MLDNVYGVFERHAGIVDFGDVKALLPDDHRLKAELEAARSSAWIGTRSAFSARYWWLWEWDYRYRLATSRGETRPRLGGEPLEASPSRQRQALYDLACHRWRLEHTASHTAMHSLADQVHGVFEQRGKMISGKEVKAALPGVGNPSYLRFALKLARARWRSEHATAQPSAVCVLEAVRRVMQERPTCTNEELHAMLRDEEGMPAATFKQVRRAAARVRDPEQADITYGTEFRLVKASYDADSAARFRGESIVPRVRRKYEKRDTEYWFGERER